MSEETDYSGVSYTELLTDQVLVVVLIMSVAGSLGTNLASPAIPVIARSFEVTDSRAGLIITMFSLTAMVSVPVTSVLADLYGRRIIAVPGILGFGALGTAIALVQTFEILLLLRALQGIAFAGTAPLAITLIGDYYDGSKSSAAQGLRSSAHGISSIIAPAIAGFVAGFLWRYPFLLYAVCIPVAGLVYLYLPRFDPVANRVTSRKSIGGTFRSYADALRVEMATPGLRILLVGGIALFLVRVAVITFVPLFAVGKLGTSTFVAGSMLSIRGIVRIIIAPSVGLLTSWFSRRTVLVSSFGISTVGAGLIGLSNSVLWLSMTIVVYSTGLSICFPVLNDAVVTAPSEEYRAGVVGGFSMLKSGASTVSPLLFGAILTASSYQAMFLTSGLLSAVYTIGLALRFESPNEPRELTG